MNAGNFRLSPYALKKSSFCIICIAAGFVPVSCIALHVLGLICLPDGFLLITVPAMVSIVAMVLINPSIGQLIFKGWIAGIIAVTLYDCSRIPFILGGWNDFVPHIGDWLLREEGTHPLIGYLWRYAGNGGGLGIAFVFILAFLQQKPSVLKGVLFGIFIFSSLMISLLIAPDGEKLMFPITAFTFSGSLVGHLIYGAVLGFLYSENRFKNNK